MIKESVWIVCVVICMQKVCSVPIKNDTEVVLVTLIYRHGERTVNLFYPNDPFKNETFYPTGPGGLTNNGKLMMFKLGEELRKMYHSLLGEVYQDGKIYVKSTNTTRTKMSALLVLAGMWPPNHLQKWHPTLNWQPIPIDVKSREDERVLNPICKSLNQELRSYHRNPNVSEKYIKPNQKLFEYVQNHAGCSVTDFIDINRVYISLKCEEDFGLTLPKWTEAVYPEQLYKAASFSYEYSNLERKFRIYNSGYLMKKIIDDMLLKVNNTLKPKDRKVFMYSGHDSSVAHLLCNLKLNCDVPDYGSTVILELHKKEEDYFVKIRYLTKPLNPVIEDLTIPGCEALCPIQHFIKLQIDNDYIPKSDKNECK